MKENKWNKLLVVMVKEIVKEWKEWNEWMEGMNGHGMEGGRMKEMEWKWRNGNNGWNNNCRLVMCVLFTMANKEQGDLTFNTILSEETFATNHSTTSVEIDVRRC